MADAKNVIKREGSESSVVSYQPKSIDLQLQQPAMTYLKHQAEKSSDFILSELIAKQTGVANVESEAYRARIEAEVLQKLQEVQENAYREAFELGKQEGALQALTSKKTELESLVQDFSQSIAQIQSLRSDILKAKEAELMEMVFLIAKKVAFKELTQDPTVIKELLSLLMEEAEADEEVKVHLSEQDHKFITDQMQTGQLVFRDANKVKLISDGAITSGGCIVQTQFGSIDSQVEVRVQKAWEAIHSRLPRTEGKKEDKREDQS